MDIILAQPRGFCAGVERAIEIVERCLELYKPPIYVLHEIVHNRHVVEQLRERGAVFVESLAEVPTGGVCIFSAHGVATAVVQQAEAQQLNVIDATCPLVTKVHLQAQRYARQGYEIIIIGHPGHPEVEGTRGRIEGKVYVLSTEAEVAELHVSNPHQLAYVTQTTLSIDDTKTVINALLQRYPHIQGPALNDICYATQNRQNAVRELLQSIDLLLVVGAHNSSNSNRLREVGAQSGVASYLIEDANDIQIEWFSGSPRVGITAGASAPEILVTGVLARLNELGIANQVRTMEGIEENTSFRLPTNLLRREEA
jgi:4-hydroxy-3-methylbut-2-en-1-yl diphosphate reductase